MGQKFPLPLAIQTADRVTTVSETYAQEILTPEFGCGLEKLLQTRHKVVSGIVNGLDMDAWDPSRDPRLPAPFSADQLHLRAGNKTALTREFDLDPDPALPLLVLVSRMDQQKGVDLAIEGLASLVGRPWQAILLGTGNPELEEACRQLESSHPNCVRAAIRFDVNLSRRMYAGGDILLMPSRYEPCGLAQMMAMRYGCARWRAPPAACKIPSAISARTPKVEPVFCSNLPPPKLSPARSSGRWICTKTKTRGKPCRYAGCARTSPGPNPRSLTFACIRAWA